MKLRVATPEMASGFAISATQSSELPVRLRKKKKRGSKEKSQWARLGFGTQACVIFAGVIVSIVILYVGMRWWMRHPGSPATFSKTLISFEADLKTAEQLWVRESEQPSPNRRLVLDQASSMIAAVREKLKGFDPPADGQEWYDEVESLTEVLEEFFRMLNDTLPMPFLHDNDRVRTLTIGMQNMTAAFQQELDATRKAYLKKNKLK